ncbi:hypothetical protein TNCV_5077011 [Trichonephila clavipes]|uniref:Uncharacterized protein n=1 Tax=Trichonephila clavipes TaxID=2585209 RepID=A0A8X6V6L4_TRICX|nr:hypothetical protein TNCV_5077011 [Trichonephila clavipes]
MNHDFSFLMSMAMSKCAVFHSRTATPPCTQTGCEGAFIAISANSPLGFFEARMAILSNQLKKKNLVM